MKTRKSRLITALLAASAMLAACACLYSAMLFSTRADAPDRDMYYEMVAQCISQDVNPLSDEEIELMVRKRLEGFALTEDETDAVIGVLDSGETGSVYRDLYLMSLFEYECNTKENHATSYYSAEDNTVHIGKNVAPNNFLVTFFHESGHAIQISLWDRESEAYDKADSFRFPVEAAAYQALASDVEKEISGCTEMIGGEELSPQDIKAVADAFINCSISPVYDGADARDTGFLAGIGEKVAEYISDEMSRIPNSNASMVSDIYGGITNNKIMGGMGHPVQTVNPDGTVSCYWYDENGQTTYNQLTEGWAEYFSAMVTEDAVNMEYNSRFFPEATGQLNELAQELLEYYIAAERDT